MTIVLNPSPMNEKILRLPLDEVDIFLLNEVEAGQILGRQAAEDDELPPLCGSVFRTPPSF